VPPALSTILGVNMEDVDQRHKTLYPLFRRTLAVVDFYLRQVVFPKEAKVFPKRLVTSAWDLAAQKDNVTTGFSGTNDARYLLPTSISQKDPSDQLGTNAKVLSYLLQPENNHYLCTQSSTSQPLSSEEFLDLLLLQDPEIRVLLDVGAQMLDKKNAELARYWLSAASRASKAIEAVLYFGDSDELTVLSKHGPTEPFLSSSFSDRLDQCAVYLDDAHTRGTDLKLPLSTRAAVTLGPGVSKDRLVQGSWSKRSPWWH
jgi:hypothetical protein